MIRIDLRDAGPVGWIQHSIQYLLSESAANRPGQAALLSRMAEALFIDSLRRYMEEMSPEATGWLAGARDPIVGAALGLLHRRPSHPWSLAELAMEVGAARSVLAERFARHLGQPPMTYLTRWRMQLAARQLQTTRKNVLTVALDSGYDSEASFNRAFKREFGLPPARFRRSQGQPVARRQLTAEAGR